MSAQYGTSMEGPARMGRLPSLGDIDMSGIAWTPDALSSLAPTKQDSDSRFLPSLPMRSGSGHRSSAEALERRRLGSAGTVTERSRINSGGPLERTRINSADTSKIRGRAPSPSPRSHPFQRSDSLSRGRSSTLERLSSSDALNRGRASTFGAFPTRAGSNSFSQIDSMAILDSITMMGSQGNGRNRESGAISALNRGRASTYSTYGSAQSTKNSYDFHDFLQQNGPTSAKSLHPDMAANIALNRGRSYSNQSVGSTSNAGPVQEVHSSGSSQMLTFSSPSADQDLTALFCILNVNGPKGQVPLRARDLPESFFGDAGPQQGAFQGFARGSQAEDASKYVADQQQYILSQAISSMDQGRRPSIGDFAGLEQLLMADPTTGPGQKYASAVASGASAADIDIMDILSAGQLDRDLHDLSAQAETNSPQTQQTSSNPPVNEGKDDILDDLDLDF